MCRIALLLLCLIFPCTPIQAHNPQLSGLRFIRSKNGIIVAVTSHISKLKSKDLDAAIRARLKIRFDGETFAPRKVHLIRDAANDLVVWQAEYLGSVHRIEVLARLFPEDPNSRCTLAVFRGGRIEQQTVLDAHNPAFNSAAPKEIASAPQPNGTTAKSFFREGITHIWGGMDHVLFVIGLLLLGGSLQTLLKTITAFTLAHSITLTFAVLEIWSPSSRVVEPIIALSIIAVAAETLLRRDASTRLEINKKRNAGEKTTRDWRPLLALGFGLIHGFGFAGALGEIGLPRESMGWALTAFNIGVEVGQAAIVLTVAPLLALLSRQSTTAHRRVVIFGSLAIAFIGAYWFVERVLSA